MYWSYHTLTSDYDFPHLLVCDTTTFTVFIACHLLQMCPCLHYCQLSQMSRSVAVHTSYRRYKAPGYYYYFSTYALQSSRLIVRSGLDVPTFTTRRLHASPRESTQRWKVELWARNVREFCLNADLHVTFRDILHAVKLRHGTDGFTSPLKEGVLRIFFALKIRRLWPCVNPRTWVPKASTLPPRPPKPQALG